MKPLPKQAILVVNAMSRRGADAFDEVRDKLVAAGIELIEAHAVDDPDQMDQTVKDAIAKAPMVIVGGGDGSLSTNVDFFMGQDTVFAVIPLGTASSFAGTLGIPGDIDSAIAVIAEGIRKRIDLGCIDGDYFVNAAAIGLSPMIAETVPHKLKRYLGMVGYLIWALWCAMRFRPFRMTVDHGDGRREKVWATEARIANGTHHGGVEVVESQQIDSGEIVIQAVTGTSVWGLGWSWFATLFKLRARHGTTREFRGRKMRLDTRPHQNISIDGEIAARTPVTVSVARGAIEV
ncbi:MAG: diacylglycerol kinase, partial [Sphingomonas bacterium]|nr:diacylglycerol kinase [Sphingomonas bacterium]